MNTTEKIFTNIDLLETEPVISLNEAGITLAKAGEMQRAEESFLKAIELNPDYPKSYHNLGILQAAQQRTKEAIDNLEKLIELEPNIAEHYCNLGIIYYLEGSYYDSELFFSMALEIDSDHPDTLLNLGKLLFNLERTDEAISLIERFHKIGSSNTEAMFILGMCFLKKNDKENAQTYWEKTLDMDPDHQQARNMLKRLNDSDF
ncbi:MAG: tetratricopeptide repeat protein [Candidatus Brocadiales bacterium]|nr:tetratricopeptide repeat protein [Candidatus Brocadiales bacterium]